MARVKPEFRVPRAPRDGVAMAEDVWARKDVCVGEEGKKSKSKGAPKF